MTWCALSNLVDGRSISFRMISDPSVANPEETVVPSEQIDGLTNPVWDEERQRPVELEDWYSSRPGTPRASGTPVFAAHLLQGTSNERPNSIGSFGARLTYEYMVPSDVWTKVPFDEMLWDTAGVFDPSRGTFVAQRNMQCVFMAGGQINIQEAVGMVRFDFALYKNGALEKGRESEQEGESEPSSYPQDRHRTGPSTRGSSFETGSTFARAGDVFEIYVHHDVSTEVFLSTKYPPPLPDIPELSMPTANYFMSMFKVIA